MAVAGAPEVQRCAMANCSEHHTVAPCWVGAARSWSCRAILSCSSHTTLMATSRKSGCGSFELPEGAPCVDGPVVADRHG